MRKLGYRLANYLHNKGFLVGILTENANSWYDQGFEDGYEEGKKDGYETGVQAGERQTMLNSVRKML